MDGGRDAAHVDHDRSRHDLCPIQLVVWLRFANTFPTGHSKEKPIRSASGRFDVQDAQARFGGRGNIANVIFGALIIAVIRGGLQQLDVSPFWSSVAIGIGILVALELDVVRKKIETKIRVLRARQANL